MYHTCNALQNRELGEEEIEIDWVKKRKTEREEDFEEIQRRDIILVLDS